MDTASLEAAFRKAFGVFWGKGTIEDFYAFFDDAGFMIDEDTPFVLTKALFKEHVDFHLAGMWTQLEWIPREPKFDVIDTTGLISTYFTLRGKPTDAGFRLRHGVCTVLCHWDGKEWRAGLLNIDPLLGHIHDASPG
jgi:hypothetical protein